MMRSPAVTANHEQSKAERKDRYSHLQPSMPLYSHQKKKHEFLKWRPYGLFDQGVEWDFKLEVSPFSHEALADIYHSKLDMLAKMQRNIDDIQDKELLFHYIVDVEGPYSHVISNSLQEMTESLPEIKSKMLARVEDECKKMQALQMEQQLGAYLDYFKSTQSAGNPEEKQQMFDQLYITLQDELAFKQTIIEVNKHHNLKSKAKGVINSKRSKHKIHVESFVAMDESKDTFTCVALLKEMLAYMQPLTSIALKREFLSTVCNVIRGRAETALKKDESKIQSFINAGTLLAQEVNRSLSSYKKLCGSALDQVCAEDGFDVQKVTEDCLLLKENLQSVKRHVANILNTSDLNIAVQLFNAINTAMPALKTAREKIILKTKALEGKIAAQAPKEAKSEKLLSSGMPFVTQSDRVEDLKDQEVLTQLDVTVTQQASKGDSQPPQPDSLVKSRHVVSRAELKTAAQLVKSEPQDGGFLGISRKSLRILTGIAEGTSHSLHNCYKATELFAVIKDLGGKLKNTRGSHYTFKLNQHSFVIVNHPQRGMRKLSGSYMMDFKDDLITAGIKLKSLCESYCKPSL